MDLGSTKSPPPLHLSNFLTLGLALAPKHNGGWGIIYHLSAPVGFSIHNFINFSMYSLSHCSVDDAYAFINHLDTGTLLSKLT